MSSSPEDEWICSVVIVDTDGLCYNLSESPEPLPDNCARQDDQIVCVSTAPSPVVPAETADDQISQAERSEAGQMVMETNPEVCYVSDPDGYGTTSLTFALCNGNTYTGDVEWGVYQPLATEVSTEVGVVAQNSTPAHLPATGPAQTAGIFGVGLIFVALGLSLKRLAHR